MGDDEATAGGTWDDALPQAEDGGRSLPAVRRGAAADVREKLSREWGLEVAIIPVDEQKKPAVRRWPERAATTREAVAALWGPREMAVGVACGKTGVWVLDLDVPMQQLRESHDPEQRKLASLLDRVIDVGQTRVLRSSGRGLPHFVWRQPDGSGVPQLRLKRLMQAGDEATGGERSGPSVGDIRSDGGQIAISGLEPLTAAEVTPCPAEVLEQVMLCSQQPGDRPASRSGLRPDGFPAVVLTQEKVDEFVYGMDSSRELAGGVSEAERAGYLAQLGPSFYRKLTRDGGMHRHDAMYATMKTAFIEALAGGYRLADAVDMLEAVYREAYEGGVAGRDVREWAGDREDDFRGIVRGRAQEARSGMYDELVAEKRREKGWYPARELEAMVDWAIASIAAADEKEKASPAAAEGSDVEAGYAESYQAAPEGGEGALSGLESLRERVDGAAGIDRPARPVEGPQGPQEPQSLRELAGSLEPGSAEWHKLVAAILDGQRSLSGTDSVALAEEVAKELGRLEVRSLAREGWKLRSQPRVELVDGVDLSVVVPEPRMWLQDTAARGSGPGLIPAGSTTLLFGASGSFKTMIALQAVKEVLQAGGRVLYLDWEMGLEKLIPRIRSMGVTQAEAKRILYAWQPGDMGPEMDRYAAHRADLVVIDSVTRVLNSYAGLTAGGSNDNDAFTRWAQERAEPLIDAGRSGGLADGHHGAAVLLLDHVGHSEADRARGASAKKDAVSQMVQVRKVQDLIPAKRQSGLAELTVKKSRTLAITEGHLRVVELAPVRSRVGEGGTDMRPGGHVREAGGAGGVPGLIELDVEVREPDIRDAAIREMAVGGRRAPKRSRDPEMAAMPAGPEPSGSGSDVRDRAARKEIIVAEIAAMTAGVVRRDGGFPTAGIRELYERVNKRPISPKFRMPDVRELVDELADEGILVLDARNRPGIRPRVAPDTSDES